MWKLVKSGVDGNCILFDVNIFDYEWISTGKKIEVLDPTYNQKHTLEIYNTEIKSKTETFATGELSNGVYGFYLWDVSS